MKQISIILLFTICAFSYAKNRNEPILGVGNLRTVHVISIGIDKIRQVAESQFAVSDSKLIIDKIKRD